MYRRRWDSGLLAKLSFDKNHLECGEEAALMVEIENRKLLPTAEIHDLVNISTTQSMTRSFRTTITTVATMIIISIVAYMRGVTSILSFSIPITVGMIAGTYSSLCIASSIWVWWHERTENKPKKKKK